MYSKMFKQMKIETFTKGGNDEPEEEIVKDLTKMDVVDEPGVTEIDDELPEIKDPMEK
jgi:hypothetical protein